MSRHARADGDDVPVDKGVVGALVRQRVQIDTRRRPRFPPRRGPQQSPNPGTTAGPGRMIRLRSRKARTGGRHPSSIAGRRAPGRFPRWTLCRSAGLQTDSRVEGRRPSLICCHVHNSPRRLSPWDFDAHCTTRLAGRGTLNVNRQPVQGAASINTSTYSLAASWTSLLLQQLEKLAESPQEHAAGVRRVVRVERAFLDSLREDGRESLQDSRTSLLSHLGIPAPTAPTAG